MASFWDTPAQREGYGGKSFWDEQEAPSKPESRGFLGATNDYVIEAANAVLGGGKAIVDFAVPGSELANQIEALIRQGEESQSDVARQAKQRLGEGIEAGGMEALGAVGSYIVENPALAVSQAVGSFAIPFGAIRGAQLGARGLGVAQRAAQTEQAAVRAGTRTYTPGAARAAGEQAIGRVGTGAGMATGAVLGAGEAGGDAYGQVYEGLIAQGVDPVEADRQATEAARLAMPAPALVGAIAGRFGAERAVATGSRGGSILRMAGSEAAQEFAEEGTTKLSANIAAGQYVDGIDPMKGVLGSAALGAALGGITGGAIGTITPRDNQPGSLLGGSNDTLTGSRTPGGDSIRQAINTGPSLPEVITVSPRGEAFISPEQQEAYDRFGKMAGRPNVAVRPQAAPAATGTPAAAPAAAQQTTRGQQAQAQPVTQNEYIATAQAYGVTPVTGVANTWDIGGARVYGQPNIKAVVEGLAEADRQATPIQRQITNALFAAGLVKAPANVANAKPIINAVGKSVQKYGLTDVASIEEAVGRINDQIGILARQGKPATNTLVEQLDQLHNVLTGQSSPVYTQLLEGAPNEQQTATGVGAVSEQAGAGQAVGGVGRTDAGPVQSLLAGSVAGQPTGVQNVAARTGGARGGAAVAPAGGPVGDGRPVSGQVADQGQKVNVQPTGRASPGAQTDVGRPAGVTGLGAEGAGAGTAEATGGAQQTVESGVERAGETEEVATARRLFDGIASRFDINSRFDNLTPSLQDIWQQAIDANQANIEVVRALDAENDINTASMSAQSVLDAAVAKLFPLERQQNKAQFVAEMLGTPQTARNETVKQLAARFGVSEDTIKKDWNRAVKALFGEDRPKLVKAINEVFAERGLNQDQISELMADLNEAVTLANTVETLTAVPEGETKVDARDLADPEKDVREADRKSLSVSEFGNEAETLSARYVSLSEEIDTVEQELEAARAEGNEDIVAQLSTRLGELTTSLEETEAAIVKNADRQVKAVRRTAGRVKQEKEDAVQESGAEKLDVRQRARTGEKVAEKDTQKPAVAGEGKAEGQAKTEGKVVRVVKAAPKAAPAAAPVELTKAEQVEANYNELRKFAPDVLPTWDMLTDEQRNTLLAIDKPTDINFKNLEQIVDQTNVIEGEVRVVPDAERTLLLEQTSKLNESQTKLLESHYGDKAGTDAFLSKLSDDITTFVNRGAEFVAARIRGIIQQLAKAAIAAAIVFNPNITGNGLNFNLQEAYASIQSSQAEAVVPADVASQMSEEAKIIYRQVAPLAKQEQRGFMIADKRNGKLHMFFASGQHLASDTALYGKDIGDTLEGNSLKGGKKITPAGKFTLKPVEDADYEGGWRLDLVETVDDGTVIAVHPAYLGDVNERRLERLASPDVKDNRISYGCINTSHKTFLNKIKPNLNEFNGGFIYVLPEAPFAPTTQTAKVQFSRRRRNEELRSSAADIEQSIYNFVGAVNQERLRIVQSIKDVPLYVREAIKRDEGIELSRTEQAFVYGGRAYLIADNIVPGTERAVFMHEVGSHLGLEKILNTKQLIALAEQIQTWVYKDDGSVESRIAKAAFDRLVAAKLEQAGVYGKLSPTSRTELIAYFIEEATLAGINPTAVDAKTALGRWFRTVWAAFKAAIRKLRLDPERLNAVDVVNMAYGAARLEVAGTWHGSAAIFQNFRTQYIGTGEGAQAFGWGMYFARSYGIAKDYFKRDKQRKAILTFANAKEAAPFLNDLIEKGEKAYAELQTFPALNRELNRDVKNPETQEVLFPKGTVLTESAIMEMHRLGVNIIEIKGSSLPKTNPDFDPLVTAAEIPLIPYAKLSEDSLWLQPAVGPTSLEATLQTAEFFKLWYKLDMPGLVNKFAKSDRSKPKEFWIQFVLNDFAKKHPEFDAAINAFYITATPAGSIMRADIGFGVDQTLIWDKPFSQQSSFVQEKLMQARDLANFPKDMLNSASGKAIYQFFATGALGRDYIAGQDKTASKKLYKLGIKGISYFDRTSRTIDFLSYEGLANLNAIALVLDSTGELLANEIERLGAEQVINKYSLPDGGIMRTEVLDYEKYIDQNRTRNIIAFNEADVVRVFSQIGMEGSTAVDRVKFSKRGDAAISRLPAMAQPQATQIYYTLKDWASKVAPTFAFTQDLVDMAKGRMRAAKDFIRLFNEKQVTQTEYELQVKKIIDDFDALPQELKGIGAGSVNEFLKDSTMSGKWGYKLKPDSDVELDPALEARFNAFPDNAQKVIKAVFNHGYQTLQDMKNTIRANINTEYDALIEEAKDAGNDQEVAELQAAKDGLLRDYQQLFAIKGNKPYAPLKRFGDYIVIGKSQRLLDLEEMFETVKGKDKAAVRKQITELQRQPEHYYVGFAETAGDGQVIAESISRQYDFVSEPFERSVEDSLYGGSDLNQVFARLRNLSEEALKSSDKDMVARGVRKTILNMQTMMLSQQSVMHATNRRLGVAGADLDMMRAFATQGRASAHFIGSLTNTSKIYESLREMKKQAGYDPESRRYFNEFVRRHAMGYDYDPSPILNKAMATTSLWMLLTSPAYYLQNMTQPFMMSVPFMAGKHNEGRSLKALFGAYPETLALLKDISIKRPGQQVDFDGLPADVREAVKELVKRGRIQITLDRDLGEFTSAEGGVLRNLGKTSEYLRGIAEKAELINRVATAIAAYRLEIASGADSSKAINYADKVIRITHGDYSGANAPRVMRKGIGRLVTQFRKFQLIQISMMVRLLNDATNGQTAKDRAMARKALVWTMTHAGIAGGIMGLPGFAAAAALYGMLFSEEDEPFNAELELRNYFGDELGTLMTKGLPANFGVDLSGKIGMGQMLSILPYTDFDLSRAGWQETVTAAMGPFVGGLVPRAIDGARFVSEGNYYRGVENFMPKGVSDTLKAYRLANEGVTQRNNDVTLTPDELNFADVLFQGLGLPTTKLTEQQFRTGVNIETKEFFSKLTTELKRDYSKAYRDNDRPALEAIRQRWKIVQDKRVARGLKRQPLSELLKSPREQRQRERQTAGGVQYTPATRKFVESLPQ